MSVSVPLHVALRPSGDQRTVITGTVTARDTTTRMVTVDIDGYANTVTAPYIGGTDPAVGDVAVLIRSANRLWMLGTFATGTQVVPPPPDPGDPDKPPTEPTTTKITLQPKATGTARNGSVRPDTNQLYQGDWTGRGVNSGMAVYRAKQLSGTVTRATLRIRRLDAGVYAAVSPTLRLMSQSSLVGNPTWQDSQTGPAMKVGETRTVTLPNSWGQKLVTGQAGGIGIHVAGSSPYVRLAGKAQGSMTLTLTIRE